MYNYLEMCHLVTQTSFYWRKKVDNLLYRLMPTWWIPLYTMVTFTRIPYKQCLALRQRQDQVLKVFRLTGYSVVGLYLLQKFSTFVIKPLAKTSIVQNILPRFAADK